MANNLPTVLFVEDCDSDFELACLGLEQARVQTQRVSCGRDLQRVHIRTKANRPVHFGS